MKLSGSLSTITLPNGVSLDLSGVKTDGTKNPLSPKQFSELDYSNPNDPDAITPEYQATATIIPRLASYPNPSQKNSFCSSQEAKGIKVVVLDPSTGKEIPILPGEDPQTFGKWSSNYNNGVWTIGNALTQPYN